MAIDAFNGAMGQPAPVGVAGWLLRSGIEELVLGLAGLAILIALAVYVLAKIRPHSAQHEHDAHQWMAKFRELHSQGGLSDEEYRTIKGTFNKQLRQELDDDNGEE